VSGGGSPIGIIAGKRQYMDALDGGAWQYGDDSIPTVGVTYFAGTFVRHPLALAACHAVLSYLKEAGPELQRKLTETTTKLADSLNAFCQEHGAPIAVKHFASVWRIVFTEDHPYQDLLFAMMRSRGIHILDNFPCFMTTAHSEADVEAIRKAYPEEKWEKYTKRQETYYGKLVPFLYARCFGLVGLLRKALVQLVGLFTPVPRQVSEADYDIVLHKSCALVAQTFMLAMSEQGYDTCPIEGFDSWRVKRALHLPYAAQVSMIVSCGVRRADVPLNERFRIPFEEQYHRID